MVASVTGFAIRGTYSVPAGDNTPGVSAKPARVKSRPAQMNISQASARRVRRISNPAARTSLGMTLVGWTNVRKGLPDCWRR